MNQGFIDDSDPKPLEGYCRKRRKNAEVIFGLGVLELAAVTDLLSGPHLLPASFTTQKCRMLATAGVVNVPAHTTSLTPHARALLEWLTSPPLDSKMLAARQACFKEATKTASRVRGLLVLEHYPREFPRAVSSSSDVQAGAVRGLQKCGAVTGSNPAKLTAAGRAIAAWFTPSDD